MTKLTKAYNALFEWDITRPKGNSAHLNQLTRCRENAFLYSKRLKG